jgi:hypothetical protein
MSGLEARTFLQGRHSLAIAPEEEPEPRSEACSRRLRAAPPSLSLPTRGRGITGLARIDLWIRSETGVLALSPLVGEMLRQGQRGVGEAEASPCDGTLKRATRLRRDALA